MSGIATAIVGGAIIGGATSLIGADKAADAAKDGNAATIAEQRRQYDTTRGDFAPYRDVGRGALTSLADIYGVSRPTEDRSVGSSAYQQAFEDYFSRTNKPKAGTNDFNKLVAGFNDIWQRGQLTGRYGAGAPPGGYPQNPDGTFGPAAGGGRVDTQPAPGQPGSSAGTGTSPAVDRTGGFYTSPGYQFRLNEGSKAIQSSAAARGKLFSGDALKAVEGYSQGVASDEFARHVSGLQSLAGVGQSATGSTAAAGANSANVISASNTNSANAVGSSYLLGARGVNNALQGGIGNWLYYKRP